MNDDNPTLRYFDAEMRYLREGGREFAERFPEQARQLGLAQPGALDPAVERLFEGFAFLMGRLREKLDDDLPELTEGVVSLIWPHYLKTLPSLCMVEIGPVLEKLGKASCVPAGFEVLTAPLGAHGTRCHYTTTQAIDLLPFEVQAFTHVAETCGRSCLRLRLKCAPVQDWSRFDLRQVRLYVNGDPRLASALHYALASQVHALYLRCAGSPRQRLAGRLHSHAAQLLPDGQNSSFSGYRRLLEYFAFPAAQRFVVLGGLDTAALPPGLEWLELDIVLRQAWPAALPLGAEHLRLHVSPVINLFPLEADPLTVCPLQSDYLLRPQRLQDGHTEIYSVDRVQGLGDAAEPYLPFAAFRHHGGLQAQGGPQRYYHTRVKRGPSGLHDTWLVLGGGAPSQRPLVPERLSVQLTATNGQLPRKALGSTLINGYVADRSDVQVRNLCPPTQPCYPPSEDRFHWRVLSHLGSTYLSLLDNPEVLRGTLALYDWSGCEQNRRRLRAITAVSHALVQRFEKNALLRGVAVEVTVDADGFSGEGDLWLFGALLSRFFALYSDVHLYNQFTLQVQPSGMRLRWPEQHSAQVPG